MKLDQIVTKIGLPHTSIEDAVLYSTGVTSFLLQEDSVQYSTHIPLSSRHRFNTLVEKLPGNVLAYNFREWFRSESIKELGKVQKSNRHTSEEQQVYSYLRGDIQRHIPDLIALIQRYYTLFPTSQS